MQKEKETHMEFLKQLQTGEGAEGKRCTIFLCIIYHSSECSTNVHEGGIIRVQNIFIIEP